MGCEFEDWMPEAGLAVVLTDGDKRVRLWGREVPYGDDEYYPDSSIISACVGLSGAGMTATMHALLLDYAAGTGLPTFLDTLVTDFADWDGIRSWESADHELRVDAAHLGRRIRLTWSLRYREYGWEPGTEPADWQAALPIHVEPGEQLRRMAADLRTVLGPGAG